MVVVGDSGAGVDDSGDSGGSGGCGGQSRRAYNIEAKRYGFKPCRPIYSQLLQIVHWVKSSTTLLSLSLMS